MWLAFFMTVPVLMALIVASLLAGVRHHGGLFRTSYFVPYVLPSVVAAFIWRVLYSATLGVAAQLEKLGIQGAAHAFLGDPATALPAIAFADNWHWWRIL